MTCQREEMAVAGDDDISRGEQCAFQDSVVGLVLQDVEVRPGLQHRGALADGSQDSLNLVV